MIDVNNRSTASAIISRIYKVFLYLLLTLGACAVLLPFFWMLSTSLKLPTQVLADPPKLIPYPITLLNYVEVFERTPFSRFMINSLIVSTLGTTVLLISSTLGGYVFASYRFRGKDIAFWVLVATMMIPPQIFAFPLYLIMRSFNLVDTYLAIAAPIFVMGFGLFLMRQAVSTIPKDLLEAACIDGCSEFRTYWNIVIPILKNAIGALSIYAFFTSWGSLLWPLIVTNSEKHYTLPLGLVMFSKQYTIEYGPMMAACTVTVVPLVILYAIFSRRIVESFALSGMKG